MPIEFAIKIFLGHLQQNGPIFFSWSQSVTVGLVHVRRSVNDDDDDDDEKNSRPYLQTIFYVKFSQILNNMIPPSLLFPTHFLWRNSP
jgi:hypothetical protein